MRALKFILTTFGITLCALVLLAPTTCECQQTRRLLFPENGHEYQRVDTNLTWTASRDLCASRGGHLATVGSENENNFVFSNFCNTQRNECWLGGQRSGSTWTWVTGEAWNYSRWNPGEPNNACNGEAYIQMSGGHVRPSFWNDEQDDGQCGGGRGRRFFPVCEYDTHNNPDCPASHAATSLGAQLLERFSPVFRLDSGETRRPFDAAEFVSASELVTEQGRRSTNQLRLASASSSSYLRFRRIVNGSAAPSSTPRPSESTPIYTHAVQLNDTSVVLQYWVFWVDNDFQPDVNGTTLLHEYHVGDWEAVYLHVVRGSDGDWTLTSVSTSQHLLWATWASSDVPVAEGNHIELLVGRGSHAHYVRGQRELFCALESTNGGRTLRQGTDYVLATLDDQPWRVFRGRWGQSQPSSDAAQRRFATASPYGPWTRTVYIDPGSVLTLGFHQGDECDLSSESRAACALATTSVDSLSSQFQSAARTTGQIESAVRGLVNSLVPNPSCMAVLGPVGLGLLACVEYASGASLSGVLSQPGLVALGVCLAASWAGCRIVAAFTPSVAPVVPPHSSINDSQVRCIVEHIFTCGRTSDHTESCNQPSTSGAVLRVENRWRVAQYVFVDGVYVGSVPVGESRDFQIQVGHHRAVAADSRDGATNPVNDDFDVTAGVIEVMTVGR